MNNAQTQVMTEQQEVITTGAVADGLAKVLANTYLLALKTQNFHWNVTGPMFSTLHTLFEAQYTDLYAAGDEIAERIRSIGEVAPGSYRQFTQYSAIEEETGQPGADTMIEQLADDQDILVKVLHSALITAEAAGDIVTADLLTGRMAIHQKAAWMLRALRHEAA